MVRVLLTYILLLTLPVVSAQQQRGSAHTIYVAGISWHTGIVVPAYSLPDSLWPPDHQYPAEAYLEIGWGDSDFFPNESFNLWYAIKAVCWPTASVLHVNPLPDDLRKYYRGTRVVKIVVNDKQLEQLIHYLLGEFELDEDGAAILAEQGLYTDSYFYKADRSYYFPNNSNVWVARALKRTGFSISPIWYQTTGWVLNKAENFGVPLEDAD